MGDVADRLPVSLTAVRVGLAVFVLAWIVGPDELRTAVPIWLVFLIALGLEVNFLVGALRDQRRQVPERGPQETDRLRYGYEQEGDELLLVQHGEEELWIPYSGEADDELEELIAEAREGRPEEPELVAHERGSSWPAVRRFLTGLTVIAVLAIALAYVDSRAGWGGLAGDTRSAAVARFSEEASRIAGKEVAIRCDESRDYVGFVQHADGVALVGGDRAYLTPERCYDLYRLAYKGDVTSSQTARAIAVLAHEAWHLQRRRRRRHDRVLRAPVRRGARRPARPLGGHRASDDAPAADGERASRRVEPRVPRTAGVPRRRETRSESEPLELPVGARDQRSRTTSRQ